MCLKTKNIQLNIYLITYNKQLLIIIIIEKYLN